MHGFWLTLALAAAGTAVLRSLLLTIRRPLSPPPRLAAAMEYVPVSILGALVFQGFLLGGGPLLPRLAAGLAALSIALAFGRDLLTIAGGLLVYWVLDSLAVF
ncbi:MAG: AzlD domain-containing protein [Deltaproteobacteria bacterium]|jgi:branched-subunit amino acid transport protein|nr:AzlD domain-containing protein [Deltaproteobacteria bacterium]